MGEQSVNIGIDLGTTYSVVAVKGKVETSEGWPPAMYLEECDVSILPTREGDYTVPSVIWIDPADPQRVMVGMEAKQQADEGGSPIMFSKRSIGTDNKLKMHDRTLTAKECAVYILKHLKQNAEAALGKRVYRAVVTHPAYFTPNQVKETREAAEAAGFEMSHDEQMMMEPIAAALAYTVEKDEPSLRVLAYDLGGGTFDVTVLRRTDGVTKAEAHEGDHLLGGYDFDSELVEWILKNLAEKGRKIPYDENNPDHRTRRARMLQLAENIKEQLSTQKPHVKVPINASDILVDIEGKKVQIMERINREEYARLIAPLMEKTIICSCKALAEAGLIEPLKEESLECCREAVKNVDLDAILMVGGSTRGPWVTEMIREVFGQEVEPYNPDLCVAVGAALHAAEYDPPDLGGEFVIDLDVPPRYSLEEIAVSGQLSVSDGSKVDLAGLRLFLTKLGGQTMGPEKLTDQNRFSFPEVGLNKDGVTRFSVEVKDADGTLRQTREFAIAYDPEGGGGDLQPVMAQPLYVLTADGKKLIAPKGVELPYDCERITLKILQRNDLIPVDLFLGNQKITTIELRVPSETPEDGFVRFALRISENKRVKGTLEVLTASKALIPPPHPVDVEFPPIKIPELHELQAQFDKLERKREDLTEHCPDPTRRMALQGKGKKIADNIRRLFGQQAPERQKIKEELSELEEIVDPKEEQMKPSAESFRNDVKECRELVSNADGDANMQAFGPQIDDIEKRGNEAYGSKNHKLWGHANHDLKELLGRLHAAKGKDDDRPLPPTPILKMYLGQEIEKEQANLEAQREKHGGHERWESFIKTNLNNCEADLDGLRTKVAAVPDSMEPRQALARLQSDVLIPLKKTAERIKNATIALGS